jgi:hypothetical protein
MNPTTESVEALKRSDEYPATRRPRTRAAALGDIARAVSRECGFLKCRAAGDAAHRSR